MAILTDRKKAVIARKGMSGRYACNGDAPPGLRVGPKKWGLMVARST
jgi:hypothetical protein